MRGDTKRLGDEETERRERGVDKVWLVLPYINNDT